MKHLQPLVASRTLVFLLTALLASSALFAQQPPLTIAESTNYEKTSLYTDVMDFIHQLQKLSPNLRVETIGTTAEGRAMPLLILGNPVPASPSDLRLNGRIPIYFQANIHAGEVEGKEAVLMLARDILLKKKDTPYLDKIVLLINPIFNADGNEKLGHNRGDIGPELAGIRYNGMNLDLNRDGLKQESPELAALTTNVLNRWDPVLFVDCHTTNGSYHEEPVTYLWPLNPNGDQGIIKYMRNKMMPAIDNILEKKYNTLSIPYGNFMDWNKPEKGWGAAGPEPRFLTNYIGLRNRLSILLENYAHTDFKTRVMGNYHFLLSVLDYCHANQQDLNKLVASADRKTILAGQNMARTDSIAITFKQEIMPEKATILGYKMVKYKDKNGRRRYKTGEKKTWHVPLYHIWNKDKCVARPYAYLIDHPDPIILKNLIQHGIVVEKLLEKTTLKVESFQIKELNPRKQPYQGHYLNKITGTTSNEEITFPVGTFFITTAQPLGSLVASLLDPLSADGLITWNFFDRYLSRQWGRRAINTPIYKLFTKPNLAKEIIR